MNKQDLQNYTSIKIVRRGVTTPATLKNHITDGPIVEMPPSNTVGTFQAEAIKLTDELIAKIVIEEGGTIRLDQ